MGSTEVGTSFMEQVIFIFPSLSCLCSYPPLWNYQLLPGQEPIVVLSLWSLLAALFGLGLAIGVVIAVRIWCKCCKYFENFLIAGWPSLLLSIPIHSSEPDRFDTLYVFSQHHNCSNVQVSRTGSEKKLTIGWLPLALVLFGRMMSDDGTT